MRALNDPVAVEKYVNRDIMVALAPSPSPEEINTYILEMSERNDIPLEEINVIGHNFTKEWKNIPSVPPSLPPSIPPGDSSFDDLAKKLDAEMKGKNNPTNPGGYGPGGNPYGDQGNPYGGNQGGYPYGNQGFNPSNQGYNGQGYNPNNNFNPYKQMDINQMINPNQNNFGPNPNNLGPNQNNFGPNPNTFVGNNTPNPPNNFSGNTPANLGPNFYVPGDITPAVKTPNPPRSSINSINDIDYYPEIDSDAPLFNKGTFNDPTFDQICERLKKGL